MKWTKEDVERFEVLASSLQKLMVFLREAMYDDFDLEDKSRIAKRKVKRLREQLVSAKSEIDAQLLLFDTLPDSAKRIIIMTRNQEG